MENPTELIQALNSGGNAAMLVCVWFIYRASERLARIEKALSKFLEENSK